MAFRIDGEKVKKMREERLYSQHELCQLSSLSWATIKRIEVGELVNVRGSTVRKIGCGLGVDPHELLLEDEGH